jgi:hypothetical protein
MIDDRGETDRGAVLRRAPEKPVLENLRIMTAWNDRVGVREEQRGIE